MAGVSMAGFRGRGTDRVDLLAVPHPAVTVVVDFGDTPVVIEDVDGREQRGSLVAGLAPGVVRVRGQGIDCVQVRLSPVAAHAVLDTSPQGIGRRVVTLEDVFGTDAPRLEETVRETTSWKERFMLLDAALTRRAEAGPSVAPEVAFAWERIVTSRGQIRVDRLALETGWSRKRLWSRFRTQIGLTPKSASKLVRFDHAAHRLSAGHSPARVAADNGYVDQSHLHRDVRDFAGVTPTALADQPWLAVDDVAWAAHT